MQQAYGLKLEQEELNMNENKNALTVSAIRSAVDAQPARSAWSRGVKAYASDLLDELDDQVRHGYTDAEDLESPSLLKRALLNGADSWSQYSWGGSSLIYDGNIAERVCCPSELKKTRGGDRRPNCREEWLDVQARALNQAEIRIRRAVSALLRG